MKLIINNYEEYLSILINSGELYCVEILNNDAVYFDNELEAVVFLEKNRLSNIDRIIKIN